MMNEVQHVDGEEVDSNAQSSPGPHPKSIKDSDPHNSPRCGALSLGERLTTRAA
jgi:hypothetical protein